MCSHIAARTKAWARSIGLASYGRSGNISVNLGIFSSIRTHMTKTQQWNYVSTFNLLHFKTPTKTLTLTLSMDIPVIKNSNFKNKNNKHKKNQNPESNFRYNLDRCSRSKDLTGAISLYESAISGDNKVHLSHYHFNALLYIFSNSISGTSNNLAIDYGFKVFDHMLSNNVAPTEATITSIARLSVANSDGDRAFEFVKTMNKYGLTPKLRTYDPPLFWFCENLMADRAYEVEEHMNSKGIEAEESQILELLRVSSEVKRGDKVYHYLHKLRKAVRGVSETAEEIVKNWFESEAAVDVGSLDVDSEKVKETMAKNGGGWHGLGWIGSGKWRVCRSTISSDGVCCSCGEQLVCVDIDKAETEKFAHSVALLAMERESKSNFQDFMEWLDGHANYEAIVDGANIALYQQNFANGGFSINQLEAVVKELHRSHNKMPLVVLHQKRVQALLRSPSSEKLLQEWMSQDVLYTTPIGSNDDWYWLYATVKLKCLLVTNDEMRDHIFELLGSNFFLKWKERHQVRYTFLKGNLKLQMPPLYSNVIQYKGNGMCLWLVKVKNLQEHGSALQGRDVVATSDRALMTVAKPLKTGSILFTAYLGLRTAE
ncbi:Pentacotripeptide-repeat region of PRORP [Dillenia turbinata]|uniref:ribonuclease P n=1 Tax=Dillenia turbinata TaxID=194707 RepID=A0AAN8VJG9_9MAGN